MNSPSKHNAGELQGSIRHALLILPAVFLGVLAMVCGGVSPVLWGQQAAAWVVFALLAWPLRRAASRISAEVWSVLLLLMLAATLFGQEAGGARRWVNLAVFHVNAAHLVLPALLAVLCCVKSPCPVLLGAAIVLSFQPDLSQLIALCVASAPILARQGKMRAWITVLILCMLIIRCAGVQTTLEPAAYCEGILAMLGDISWLMRAAGFAALAAVPAVFAADFCRHKEVRALSFAAYYAASMLFAFSGEYPVLLMGFGLSPIAGYCLAYAFSKAVEPKE